MFVSTCTDVHHINNLKYLGFQNYILKCVKLHGMCLLFFSPLNACINLYSWLLLLLQAKKQPSRIYFLLRQVGRLLFGMNTCPFEVQALRIWRYWQRRLASWISRVERRITVVLRKSGLGRLSWQRLLLVTVQWSTSAGLPKSGVPTSEQPDPDPAGARYI